jgi:uncharacterized protein (TIGR02265 family)
MSTAHLDTAGAGEPAPGPRPGDKVKGTLLLARLKFVKARGPDATERVLRRLSAADQAVLRGVLLPSTWYPADLLARLELTAAALLAQGSRPSLFTEMGRFSAATNLASGGMQRPYLREGDPHFLLANVPRMYTSQHSVGHRTYEKVADQAALIRSFDEEPFSADDCRTTAGWLEEAVTLSGGRRARVDELKCRSRGAAHCEFHCSWT